MKKIIHILITAIFIYNIMGYFAIFQVLQFKAKHEIKNTIKTKLPASALTIIAVSEDNQSEINWFEEEKEFKYHGMMYDIVRKVQKGNITYYYCISDPQEKDLFANLNAHIEKHVNNDLSKNKQTKSVIQKIIKDYFFIAKFAFNEIGFTQIYYFNKTELVKFITQEITAPPPELIA